MATMYITEYEDLARDGRDSTVQAGQEPGNGEQIISFTGTAGNSANFAQSTRFIRVKCDGPAQLAFGAAAIATSSNSTQVSANIPEFFGVIPGQRVSAITGGA